MVDIHEYQAKELFKKFSIPVPEGKPAFSAEEAKAVAENLDTSVYVIKSQIHAGGRGKGKFKETPDAAGGVRIVKTPEEVYTNAKEMLGNTLVTVQTGEKGKKVEKLYIETGSNIEKEYYLSLLIDRAKSNVSFIASTEGGMDIEKVAHENPEKIITVNVDVASGISGFHIRKLTFAMGFEKETAKQFKQILISLYDFFLKNDSSQVEINPLVKTKEGNLLILDAKCGFDDNALYRLPHIMEYRDITEENEQERKAKDHDLNYVKMTGNIGCMVNGAGLAMATMDIIKLKGGEPANFLDVGGGADVQRITEAFKIILSDHNIKAILVNIFGGIVCCDLIANGIVEAAKIVHLEIPLVVRIEGTNVELGKKILEESNIDVIFAANLDEAAQKAVDSIK